MKIYQLKRRSKRISTGLSKRQLFVIAGAFLVTPFMVAPSVYAEDGQSENKTEIVEIKPIEASPLLLSAKENEAKIQAIEANFKVQQDLVDSKLNALEKQKQENASVSQTKLTLEQEVAAMKAEVEAMKARVAEKKALEAEKARLEAERSAAVSSVGTQTYRGSAQNVGNRYAPGNCTYYVYNRRPDIGSFWGNANQWLYSAQADGFATSSRPQVGAIAWTGAGYAGHVAYVEGVSGDQVTISEMNYGGLWNMNTRTVHYTEFQYILW